MPHSLAYKEVGMIDMPTPEELKTLGAVKKQGCVTMYVPYLDPKTSAEATRLNFKNLLREARTELTSCGITDGSARKTLRPLLALLSDDSFWLKHHESLAIFAHNKFFKTYSFHNSSLTSMVTVGDHFNIVPLEKIVSDNERYFVLALSHNDVKLFEGDRYDLHEVQLEGLPNNMEKALNIDERYSWSETHEIAPSYTGKGSEAYHGQYNAKQADKVMLKEFFRRIDRRLGAFLSRNGAPLIIAGVNYLLPIYRKVNTYPNLVPEFITGNLEHSSYDSIRMKAWSTIKHDAVSYT